MAQTILGISDRGQITIPQKIRVTMNVKFFTCDVDDGAIVLKPLKTREEFFEELEERSKDWDKHGGGLTLDQMAKKYHL